jgi:hypothetical protein
MTLHVITIASSVTKIRWRPPAFDYVLDGADEVDRHDSMFAVATARLTSAGGSGVISLWSTHRPFMPLSVVEGHEDGAVADFVWMQTPPPSKEGISDRSKAELQQQPHKIDQRSPRIPGNTPKNDDTVFIRSGGRGDVESILFDNNPKETEGIDIHGAIWQHVLSVGRDGKCNLQSFVRGTPSRSSTKNQTYVETYHTLLILWQAIAQFHECLPRASQWPISHLSNVDMGPCSSSAFIKMFRMAQEAISS